MLKQNIISSKIARKLVDQGLKRAASSDWRVAIAIVDPWGELVAFGKDDEALKEVSQFAMDKAYTAARMGGSTASLYARAEAKPQLMAGLANRARLLVFPGGLTILRKGEMIGAIGISGAQDHEDVELAERLIEEQGLEHG